MDSNSEERRLHEASQTSSSSTSPEYENAVETANPLIVPILRTQANDPDDSTSPSEYFSINDEEIEGTEDTDDQVKNWLRKSEFRTPSPARSPVLLNDIGRIRSLTSLVTEKSATEQPTPETDLERVPPRLPARKIPPCSPGESGYEGGDELDGREQPRRKKDGKSRKAAKLGLFKLRPARRTMVVSRKGEWTKVLRRRNVLVRYLEDDRMSLLVLPP